MQYSCLSLLMLLLLVGVTNANPTKAATNGIRIHILHTNDMHARFAQTSKLSGTCNEAAKNTCYGGFARVATIVRKARAQGVPTLYLDAGDVYQGTIWFVTHKWSIVAKFMNILKPDAMSLGNHEFDSGPAGLVPFIENATFPILAANLNLTNEPELAATKLAKSTVIDFNGTKVGIIGYLTPDTKNLALTENVTFLDEIEAISEEAKKLKENGIKILIALGHSGYTMDQKIAENVEDIDLVIGGHTNTFLYNGTGPDYEIPVGLYPTAVTQSSGKTVYVVQAYAYTKYIGNLSVDFNSEGELTHIEGNPILLDSKIEEAADVLEELNHWRTDIDNLTLTVVGSTRVFLNGDVTICRRRECNLGNLITDALVDYNSRQYNESTGWTDAAIAVLHSGCIRASITTDNDNQITVGDILTVLPFGTIVETVSMTGEELLSMLEWSVYYLTGDPSEDLRGAFLQFSGIQVTYDLSQPANSKVVSVQVRCASCDVPVFNELNKTQTYSVIMNHYIRVGGDGYEMLTNLDYKSQNVTIADVLINYLGLRSPVYPSVEWRITFTETESTTVESGASYITYSITTVALIIILGILT